MAKPDLVKFICPEKHVIEVDPKDIHGNALRCEKCGKQYRFKKVELESLEKES